jgi:hypothetical protein
MPQESMLASVRAILLANAAAFASFGPSKGWGLRYVTLKSLMPRELMTTAPTKAIVIPSRLAALAAEPLCRFSLFFG